MTQWLLCVLPFFNVGMNKIIGVRDAVSGLPDYRVSSSDQLQFRSDECDVSVGDRGQPSPSPHLHLHLHHPCMLMSWCRSCTSASWSRPSRSTLSVWLHYLMGDLWSCWNGVYDKKYLTLKRSLGTVGRQKCTQSFAPALFNGSKAQCGGEETGWAKWSTHFGFSFTCLRPRMN